MSRWLSAPEPPAPEDDAAEPTLLDGARELVASLGLETGLAGAGLVALGALFAALTIARLVALLSATVGARYTEGEVIDTEPAEGGGLNPVIAFTDLTGRRRRQIARFKTAGDPIGRRVLMRIDGDTPRVAPPPRGPGREALRLVGPLLLAGLMISTGVTWRIAGLVPIPVF